MPRGVIEVNLVIKDCSPENTHTNMGNTPSTFIEGVNSSSRTGKTLETKQTIDYSQSRQTKGEAKD